MTVKKKNLLTEELLTNKPMVRQVAREKLVPLLAQNGYSRECVEVFEEYWAPACLAPIIGATFAAVAREKMWMSWDTFARMPLMAFKTVNQIVPGNRADQIKKIFNSEKVRALGQVNKKKLFFVLVVATITGVATTTTFNMITSQKTKESLTTTIGDALKMIVQYPVAYLGSYFKIFKNSDVGKGVGLQSNDCALVVYSLLAAAGAVTVLLKTKGFRPVAKIQDLVFEFFAKRIKKTRDTIGSLMLKNLPDHLEGKQFLPNAKEFFEGLVSNTSKFNNETLQQAKNMYRDRFGDDLVDEADDVIELIWKDGIYQQDIVVKELAEEAGNAARQSDNILRDKAEDLQQMGFDLDNTPLRLPAPDADDLPAIVAKADSAFKSGNAKEALDSLDELVDFYKSIDLIDDKIIKQEVDKVIKEVKDQYPEATDFELIRILISKSDDILAQVPLPVAAKGAIAKIAKTDLDVPDTEIANIIEEQVDDLLFYSTGNLPGVNPLAIPDMRDEAVESTMSYFQKLKEKVPAKHALMLAVAGVGTILTADAIYSKKEFKPSGSPYYFDDDSIYSFLNGPTGAKNYIEYRNSILSNKDLMNVLSKLIFNQDETAVGNYLSELSNGKIDGKKIDQTKGIEEKAEEAVRGYAEVIKNIGVPGDVMDSLSAQATYGISSSDETTINKRNAMFQMVLEMFLFNDVVFNQIKKYFKKIVPTADPPKRLIILKKIFSFDKAKRSSAIAKLNKIENFYAKDNREMRKSDTSVNEVKQMSKKDLRSFVREILNENTGQGYGKYPYHSNEHSEQEPDQDYNVEWGAFVDDVCGSKKKNIDGDPKTIEDMSVEVAKLLVRDSDLFRDVLEMAGANKSIGVEIMNQLKASMEKKKLDKEMNV